MTMVSTQIKADIRDYILRALRNIERGTEYVIQMQELRRQCGI